MTDSMGEHVDRLLASIVEDAERLQDHRNNYDEHLEELRSGQREPDEYLNEEIADANQLWQRWQEGIYGVGKKVVFTFILAGGGPGASLEVECDITENPWGDRYVVSDVWLEGSWAGPTHRVEVYEGQALWELAEEMIELEGER